MGVINHNAVLATTWDDEAVVEFKAWLEQSVPSEWRQLFHVGTSLTNGYQTVVMTPDGSNEGWDTSDDGDRIRDAFIAFLNRNDSARGYNPWNWVEVSYGEYGQRITKGNNHDRYG